MSELTNPTVIQPLVTKKPINPAGFGVSPVKTRQTGPTTTDDQLEGLILKKVWATAVSPSKSIPMNVIMSYMTGNSLQIIPMTMTLMLLWNPLKAIIFETNPAFKGLQSKNITTEIFVAKLLFILCQLANMAVGVYKLYKMGLIPNTEADWLAWNEIIAFTEKLSA